MTEISAGTGTGRFPAGTDIPMELLEPLSDAEKEKDVIARKSQSYVKMVWGRLKKDKLAMFGLVVLFLMIVFAVFAPIFLPMIMHRRIFIIFWNGRVKSTGSARIRWAGIFLSAPCTAQGFR